MKVKALKSIVFVFTMLVCSSLKAQTFKATYTYDENGNRLTASVVYLTQTPSSPSTNNENNTKTEEDLKVDDVTNLTIRVFPNPTKGNLRVELTGVNEELLKSPNNAIRVWDIQGRLMFSINVVETSNLVDLSGYGNGTYIMQLFINGKVKDFKIVKN